MRKALWIFLLLGCGIALAAIAAPSATNSGLPPKPARYVEDAAGLLNAQTRDAINAKLDAFERETSSQVVVAIFPKVPDGYAMEDFTQRTAEAWGVGQKKNDNGAVFFIFPQDHKMRIEVGYGLEGAIPDATAKTIMDREVTPAFRSGDFAGGVTHGVDAILAAARGEYKGTGKTNADSGNDDAEWVGLFPLSIIFLGAFFLLRIWARSGTTYSGKGRKRRSSWSLWPPASGGFGGGGNRWGGGGSSGGGFGGGSSGGGGGGFSGGGGSFGGGGASGGW
jgi:uncharacterized protein